MRLGERAYLRVADVLPDRVAAWTDRHSPVVERTSYGPMNGQLHRQELVRRLVRGIDFDEIVETGTFRAETTLFLSDVAGLPVRTVELSERFYRYSERVCAHHPLVDITWGDSREFLTALARRDPAPASLFYLDAHWGEDVPRAREVEIVMAGWHDAVIVIDDFYVPDDPGYGYVTYGSRRLDLSYLPELGDWRAYYPSRPGSSETGAARGCVVVSSPSLAPLVESTGMVRPVEP